MPWSALRAMPEEEAAAEAAVERAVPRCEEVGAVVLHAQARRGVATRTRS